MAFVGSAAKPTIIVIGSGFGLTPKPDPAICPAETGATYDPGCKTQPSGGTGSDGNDYGRTGVGMDWAAPSGQVSAGKYVAGEYLSCVGVVIRSWSATKVAFTLGRQYTLYAKAEAGENYIVEVRGGVLRGVIRYEATAPETS